MIGARRQPMADVATESKKPRQGRSPAYPSINLEKALAQARALLDSEGKYAVPLASAFRAWGYGGKSSAARQTLASLKYYGLIEVEGEGDSRKIRVSEDAIRYLLDKREDPTDRKTLMRRFALAPTAHLDLFNQFPEGLKSDATVVHFLMFECGFNEGAANELLGEFKATAVFANLFKPATTVDNMGESPDPRGAMRQAELADEVYTNPVAQQGVRPAATIPGPAASEAEEELWLKGPLPGGARYKIFVTGEMGPKEIGKLIKVLEAQKEMLSDD
jgi:hypothetical protein